MDNEPEKGEKALLIFFQWTVWFQNISLEIWGDLWTLDDLLYMFYYLLDIISISTYTYHFCMMVINHISFCIFYVNKTICPNLKLKKMLLQIIIITITHTHTPKKKKIYVLHMSVKNQGTKEWSFFYKNKFIREYSNLIENCINLRTPIEPNNTQNIIAKWMPH